ncbi:MAG: helix-turn-helix domain-containing protein [Lentilitoribacter sp.]
MEKLMDIAEVAQKSGVSTSGLRYYEKRKLICAVSRNGLRRQYEPDVIQELALITLAKSAGFTLNEIGALLQRPVTKSLPRNTLIQKARDLEEQAERLQNLSRMLHHVANCPHESHFDCTRFNKLLKVATRVAND